MPYSVFSRAGKRGHYENCGMIVLRPDEAGISSDVTSTKDSADVAGV